MAQRLESVEVRDVFEWEALALFLEERGGRLREAEPPQSYPQRISYWRTGRGWRPRWAGLARRQALLLRERAEELRQRDRTERQRQRAEKTPEEIAAHQRAMDAAFARAAGINNEARINRLDSLRMEKPARTDEQETEDGPWARVARDRERMRESPYETRRRHLGSGGSN
ncbi:hypothetical protein ACGFW5_06425 [Streptomyces sp. NPDC048416]|uniref:hypothetical protein n=1 Tax=Streptomyces sp. NPDC048416 TaxID=3365546 RepID=UPI0037132663